MTSGDFKNYPENQLNKFTQCMLKSIGLEAKLLSVSSDHESVPLVVSGLPGVLHTADGSCRQAKDSVPLNVGEAAGNRKFPNLVQM